ncbi:MAG: hypothetical protein SFT92_09050 [Rickettsiales bacterium]|nr:hypothetical protein [Rickettsiales bacterium]
MRKRLLSGMLFFCLLPTPSFAGAWLQKEDKGLVVMNTVYYSAGHYFDNKGEKRAQPLFTKQELNPYIEYGYSERWTFGTNLSFERNHSANSPTSPEQTSWGMGDSEFFARTPIYEGHGFMVSFEPQIKLPSPTPQKASNNIGSKHVDFGPSIGIGRGFDFAGYHHYINLDSSYRHRSGNPGDQIRFGATAGIQVAERIELLPQFFLTYRTSSNNTGFSQSSGDDYNLSKIQFSTLYHFDDFSVQAGAFSNIAGVNTGDGYGGMLALWRRF